MPPWSNARPWGPLLPQRKLREEHWSCVHGESQTSEPTKSEWFLDMQKLWNSWPLLATSPPCVPDMLREMVLRWHFGMRLTLNMGKIFSWCFMLGTSTYFTILFVTWWTTMQNIQTYSKSVGSFHAISWCVFFSCHIYKQAKLAFYLPIFSFPSSCNYDTVDGRNPAPPGMYETL